MNRLFCGLLAALLCVACTQPQPNYRLIPYPDSLTPRSGSFDARGAAYYCDAALDEASQAYIRAFADQLAQASGSEMTASEVPGTGFNFRFDETLPAEHYVLEVEPAAVTAKASSLRGFVYAVQTLRQLLPAEIFGTEAAPSADWSIPCVRIADEPRFGYRGLHIDVARHFFGTEQMKKILGLMSLHKLNTLHWHLTDDQGWRVEIKKYPRLTEYGSIRKQTVVKKEWDRGIYDGVPYGGYYTQDEIRDVVACAAAQGITVIPEIDLPGHMLAALASYPELGCTGGPYEVWGRWGVSDDVLCPGKEQTFTFIEDVLSEILELFPSEYIHIGGDECPKVRWESCPHCQARIRALGLKGDEQHSAEHYLQSYVMARVERFLNERGRRIIGWDEILEGEVAPNATIMSWRGSEGGIVAANMGHDVLMTPNSHFYFDYYQAKDIDREPFGIGGYVPVELVYGYEPFTDEMTDEVKAHIKGVQANLWSEYILTPEHQEYMLLPRLAALSEVQWCRTGRRDWKRFVASLPHLLEIYTAMGCNFATTVFEVAGEAVVNPKKGCVEMSLTTVDNAPIRYTLDGSEPTEESPLYKKPLEIREACMLKARAFRTGIQTQTFEQQFVGSKALGHAAVFNTAPVERFTYNGAPTLVDGIESFMSFTNGAWIGWLEEPMDVTIDLGGDATYGSVQLCALVNKIDWIFAPASVTVSTSDDGEHFTEVAVQRIAPEQEFDPDGIKHYTVQFPETSARWLRIVAEPVDTIPDWHGGHGNQAYLFVGEIEVE